jgi:hypothetical protein
MRDKYHEVTAVSAEGQAKAEADVAEGDPIATHSSVPPTKGDDVPFGAAAEANEAGAL